MDKYYYTTKYGTARTLGQVISFVGWFVLSICGLLLILAITKAFENNGSSAFMLLLVACGGVISGLFLILLGQITQALVDGADNTGEMLAIMKFKSYSNHGQTTLRDYPSDNNIQKLGADGLVKILDKDGDAYCLVCHKVSKMNGMFYDKVNDKYYHEDCVPKN